MYANTGLAINSALIFQFSFLQCYWAAAESDGCYSATSVLGLNLKCLRVHMMVNRVIYMLTVSTTHVMWCGGQLQ